MNLLSKELWQLTKTYVVHLSDKQRQLMTEQLIREHVNYLRSLKEKGVLPFCGPCKDGTALMILNCDSMEDAEKIVADDPFSKVNYYHSRRIVEIEEATIENDFHLEQVLDYLAAKQ